MSELQKSFNEYMKSFTELTTFEKREEILEKIKELMAVVQQISTLENKETEMLFNREMIDANKDEVSEDDFLEATFAYLSSLEELIGQYFLSK